MALWGSSVRFCSAPPNFNPESKRIRGFLFKGRSKVFIGVGRSGDGVIILLAPNLFAYFHVDVTAVAWLISPTDEFMVIAQAALAGKHKAWFTFFNDRVLYDSSVFSVFMP